MANQNRMWVEILNTKSSGFGVNSAWTDITAGSSLGDVIDVQAQGLGFSGAYALTPSLNGSAMITLDNSRNSYLPDILGYAGNKIVENYNRIRVRASGPSFANCLRVYYSGGTLTGTINQVYTATIAAATVWTFTYQARAQYDFVGNTDSAVLKSNLTDITTVAQIYTNRWITYTVVLIMSATPAASLTVQVSPGTGCTGHQYIEYRNFSLTCPSVNSGLNVLTNASFASGAVTPWIVTGTGGTTVNATVQPDSAITFNGKIYKSIIDFAWDGTQRSSIACYDFFYYWQKKKMNPPPAIYQNVGSDALVNALLTYMQAARSVDWWPGQLIDTGILTAIDTAFDKYNSMTQLCNALADITDSEGGSACFDLDGTFIFGNQQFLPKKQKLATVLDLTDGVQFSAMPQRDSETIINNVAMTYHPRSTTGSVTTVWSQNQPTLVPAGTGVSFVVQFRDAITGQPCGAKSVVSTLVANTDYKINEQANGTGVDYTVSAFTSVACTVATQAGQPQATQATITITNTASGNLYCTILQIRGICITTYGPQQVVASNTTSINRTIQSDLTKDLLFINDAISAQAQANFFIRRFKDPYVEVPGFVTQNEAQLNGVDLVSLKISDTVSYTASKMGMSALKHMLVGVSYQMNPNAGNAMLTKYSAVTRVYDPYSYAVADISLVDGTDVIFM